MSATSGTGVSVRREGAVVCLTLERPERRNALDDSMVAALASALVEAGQDEAVRAVRLRGAGQDFCAGFDILARNAAQEGARPRVGSIQRRLPSGAHRLIPLVRSVQVPVICQVQGWAAGIGLHLALAADFAVVADDARLWEPFSQRGFTPDSGGTWLLARRVGEVRARQMLLLGREVTGAEAAAWGLVHQAVPAAELDAAADRLVTELAEGPTVALGLTKWLINSGSARDLEAHLAEEAFALELSSRSEDFREGLGAFAEKRSPRFRGR